MDTVRDRRKGVTVEVERRGTSTRYTLQIRGLSKALRDEASRTLGGYALALAMRRDRRGFPPSVLVLFLPFLA